MSNNGANKKDQIKLDVAIDWARNWREQCPDNCKAFLIPASDLINVLEEMNVLVKVKTKNKKKRRYKLKGVKNAGVRAYMAIDPEEPAGGGEKLLIVGTTIDCHGEHRDIVEGEKPTGCPDCNVGSAVEGLEGSGVYDFTDPCPNTCDQLSPLFTLED